MYNHKEFTIKVKEQLNLSSKIIFYRIVFFLLRCKARKKVFFINHKRCKNVGGWLTCKSDGMKRGRCRGNRRSLQLISAGERSKI